MIVPVIVPRSTPPSPEAEELAQHLVEAVEQYRETRPELVDGDVDTALRLARDTLSPRGVTRVTRNLIIAILIGLLAVGLIFSIVAYRGGLGPIVAVFVLIVAVAVAVLAMAMSERA